jgi:hypothetical protein
LIDSLLEQQETGESPQLELPVIKRSEFDEAADEIKLSGDIVVQR